MATTAPTPAAAPAPPAFAFGRDCGQHCGSRHGQRLTHCPTCHQLTRVARQADMAVARAEVQ